MYQYTGTIIKVSDGDTCTIDVDLGFSIRQKMIFRLHGINTPEVIGPERTAGLAAKHRVEELLPPGKDVVINTYKDRKEKFGRYLAEVSYFDENKNLICINELLVKEGLAKPFMV